MIVKMQKTTVLCLKQDRELSLEKLRETGVLHVEILKKQYSEDREELELLVNKSARALEILASRRCKRVFRENQDGKNLSGKGICENVLSLNDKISALHREIENLLRDREKFLPWGNFSWEIISDLKKNGVYILLCDALEDTLEYLPSDAVVKIVKKEKKKVFFALASKTKPDNSKLSAASLPEHISLDEIKTEIQRCKKEIGDNEKSLDRLHMEVHRIRKFHEEMREQLEFLTNRDGMLEDGELSYIQGYVPVTAIEKLKNTARENQWALLFSDPSDEDNVPTFITVPKIFRIVRPVFEFIGLSPGYREWDVSICFLIFFTIFFGIIVGDAGYGLIFLSLAVFAKFKMREEKFRLPVNLFIVLSMSAVIWGALNGTFFAIPSEHLPKWMRGIEPLTNPETKNTNVQFLCFLLAAVHLSIARVWKTIIAINSVKCLGELGWAFLIWGNFLTAVQLMIAPWPYPAYLAGTLYATGFILICLFSVNRKEIGEIFNLPFNLIGSFADVLSYIRLFALGLAGFYIADSFNQMSKLSLALPVPAAGIILMVIVLLFGHLLNIAMSLISVLVHAIRLNTLEFSNHMGLQWSGTEYKPFRKKMTTIKESCPSADGHTPLAKAILQEFYDN